MSAARTEYLRLDAVLARCKKDGTEVDAALYDELDLAWGRMTEEERATEELREAARPTPPASPAPTPSVSAAPTPLASRPVARASDTFFEEWNALHRGLCEDRAVPLRLVRVHVVNVPDNLECSPDGQTWGVLVCKRRPSGAVARVFWKQGGGPIPGDESPWAGAEMVGYGFDEYVFLRAEAYDALRVLTSAP